MYAGTLLEIAMIHSDSVIEKAQKGDEHAVNKLVGLWYKRIYNYCKKYFNDHDLAQEVTQKTFIAMYRNINSLRDPEKFKAWIYRIAANNCHQEERMKKSQQTVSMNNGTGETESLSNRVTDGSNPYKKMQMTEMNDILLLAVNSIPPEQRQVLIMKEFEGLKFREIAEILEISENTAKSRLYYGLSSLKKELKERNINKNTVYYEA